MGNSLNTTVSDCVELGSSQVWISFWILGHRVWIKSGWFRDVRFRSSQISGCLGPSTGHWYGSNLVSGHLGV